MQLAVDKAPGNVVIMTRFTLHGEQEQFEKLFKIHESHMRAQAGYMDCYLVQSPERPELFSHVGWWETISAYQKIRETTEYQEQMTGLMALCTIDDVAVFVPTAP
jgi:long-chain acyl-CoA synthetase